MATLVLTAVGALVGGPLGAAIGAFAGNQVDRAVIGGGNREGPRLRDLAVQQSGYGVGLPRVHGRMRLAGTVIWSTDLVESSRREGGGKGQPSVTVFDYSVTLAVALSSRPALRLGRIWAEGNLLRDGSGALSQRVTLRFHGGHGDQLPDSAIEAAEGKGQAPAYRGLAYVVLEDLALAEFGNRIPSLSFELVADDGAVTLVDAVAERIAVDPAGARGEPVIGLALEAGTLADNVSALGPLVPPGLDETADGIRFGAGDALPARLDDVLAADGGEAGEAAILLRTSRRSAGPVLALRYADADRDYQPGLQRARRSPRDGEFETVELAATLSAPAARRIADNEDRRRRSVQDRLRCTVAALRPDLRPGSLAIVAGEEGIWRVEETAWTGAGCELRLVREHATAASAGVADPGRTLAQPLFGRAPTRLHLIDLPALDPAATAAPAMVAAAWGGGCDWPGAQLWRVTGGEGLTPLGEVRLPAIAGECLGVLQAGSPNQFDTVNALDVRLACERTGLAEASALRLAAGANLAAIGNELVQFAHAEPMGAGVWRISGFARGRGGTADAIAAHQPGETFVLLDGAPLPVPLPGGTPSQVEVLALGMSDAGPVSAMTGAGRSLRPLAPVHLRMAEEGQTVRICWTARARARFDWPDGVDVVDPAGPLHFRLALAGPQGSIARNADGPDIRLDRADLLQIAGPGRRLAGSVEAVGPLALSLPARFDLWL